MLSLLPLRRTVNSPAHRCSICGSINLVNRPLKSSEFPVKSGFSDQRCVLRRRTGEYVFRCRNTSPRSTANLACWSATRDSRNRQPGECGTTRRRAAGAGLAGGRPKVAAFPVVSPLVTGIVAGANDARHRPGSRDRKSCRDVCRRAADVTGSTGWTSAGRRGRRTPRDWPVRNPCRRRRRAIFRWRAGLRRTAVPGSAFSATPE